MTRQGIDIASYQHPESAEHPGGAPIDWQALRAAGFDWVAIKVTEGTGYYNPWFEQDAADAAAHGFEVVGYHFARPTQGNGQAQAQMFKKFLARSPHFDGFALDLEDGRQLGLAALNEWCREFIANVELNDVYYDESYRQALAEVGGPWGLGEWVADPSATAAPAGCRVWQKGQRPVPGVAALTDVNDVFYDRGTPTPAPGEASASSHPPVSVELPVLASGSTGYPVKAAQTLANLCGAGTTVDGVYGPATAFAVAKLQEAWAITASGEVDADTWARLLLIG